MSNTSFCDGAPDPSWSSASEDQLKNIMRLANGLEKNVKSWRESGLKLNDDMNKPLGLSPATVLK